MRQLVIILILYIPNYILAQTEYVRIKNKVFYSTEIDTLNENILVVEKKHAIVYFRQLDLINQISDTSNSTLIKILGKGTKTIHLTDWWFDYTEEDRQRLFGDINYENPDKKYINELIYIGADLINENKTMIIEKCSGIVVTKKMKAKHVNGLYGTTYIEFRLPDRKAFWTILLEIGE